MNTKIIDLHTDLFLSYLDDDFSKVAKSQIDVAMAKKTNASALFGGFGYDGRFGKPGDQLDVYYRLSSEGKIHLLGKKQINKEALTVVLALEGGGFIKNIEEFEILASRGVKSIGLTHNYKNSLACGAVDDDNTGLTKLGRSLVNKADELGVIVDLAHINNKGFKEIEKVYSKPLFLSHTCSRSLNDNPRNATDGQLKIVAKSGGLVGIFFSNKFVSAKKRVGLDDAVDHFIYIAGLIGVKHVGVGSDFGGITTGTPENLKNFRQLKNLFKALRKRGFSVDEVESIAHKNAERFLRKFL